MTRSPIGERVGAAGRRVGGAEYRRQRDRLYVSEGVARQVIMRRDERGLSQRELADRVGTSRSVIWRLERGQHRVPIEVLERVSRALGLPVVVTPAS